MFNIKREGFQCKNQKQYMAQTEQSWLICDGDAQTGQSPVSKVAYTLYVD